MALRELRKKITSIYPFGGPERVIVPEDKIDWSIQWLDYSPPYFTSEKAKSRPWADKEFNEMSEQPKWNSLDGKINRISHTGNYTISDKGLPLNPIGRTGLEGRGALGRWGPNHAGDPIVTMFKRDQNGSILSKEGKQILQFIGIERRDNGEIAIPGGMVDPGEEIAVTLKREFLEEVFSIDEATLEEKKQIENILGDLFTKGIDIYKGICDDPRNTDNSWIETHARVFHIEEDLSKVLKLKAGSDAKNAKWIEINSSLALYANHRDFIEKVCKHFNAFW